jgi:hypothetical protein
MAQVFMRARDYSFVVTLWLSTTALAGAQNATRPGAAPLPDDQETVVRLLWSPDAREQAWGAWFAGRDHRVALTPLLQQIVATRTYSASQSDYAAFDIALDGLIQMRSSVAPELLPLIYERRPTQALILAAHSGANATGFLLDVLNREEGHAWFAAANMLLPTPPQGYAAVLLRKIRTRAHVYVSDDGQGGYGEGSASGVSIGCGFEGEAAGLPPWASYTMTPFAHPGVVVLSMGPKPVYYRRTVAPAGQTPAGGSVETGGPTTADRLQYIAALLRITVEDLPVQASESHTVIWRGAAELSAAIDRIRADALRRYARLVSMLRERGVFGDGEPAELSADRVEIVIHDARRR